MGEVALGSFRTTVSGRSTDVPLEEGDVVLGVSAATDAPCTNVTLSQLPSRPGRPGALRVRLHGGPDCAATLVVVVARP